MARQRSKLNPELAKAIVERIDNGAYPEVAARAENISKSVFYKWLKNHPKFKKLIEGAAARLECRLVAKILAGDEKQQNLRWYLSVSRPTRWAKVDRSMSDVQSEIGEMSDKELMTEVAKILGSKTSGTKSASARNVPAEEGDKPDAGADSANSSMPGNVTKLHTRG